MKRVMLLACFFFTAPAVLFSSLVFLSYLTFHKMHSQALFGFVSQKSVAYAALPSMAKITEEEIAQVDSRIEMVRQFFANYKSPLEPFAKDIVKASDTYGLDFRLLPAIAMQESNLCKKEPPGSHNCWGFGIYGKHVQTFDNYPQAINAVSKTLAKEYKAKGLNTPEEIVSKYTPSDNGKWVNGVLHFMNLLQ